MFSVAYYFRTSRTRERWRGRRNGWWFLSAGNIYVYRLNPVTCDSCKPAEINRRRGLLYFLELNVEARDRGCCVIILHEPIADVRVSVVERADRPCKFLTRWDLDDGGLFRLFPVILSEGGILNRSCQLKNASLLLRFRVLCRFNRD